MLTVAQGGIAGALLPVAVLVLGLLAMIGRNPR